MKLKDELLSYSSKHKYRYRLGLLREYVKIKLYAFSQYIRETHERRYLIRQLERQARLVALGYENCIEIVYNKPLSSTNDKWFHDQGFIRYYNGRNFMLGIKEQR